MTCKKMEAYTQNAVKKMNDNSIHFSLVDMSKNKIKKSLNIRLFFMERETRLELATSSLARRHSTTELPPHRVTSLLYMDNFFLQVFFYLFLNIFKNFCHKLSCSTGSISGIFCGGILSISRFQFLTFSIWLRTSSLIAIS